MSTVFDELRRRFEETRVRVRSQIESVRTRLGLPQGGILGKSILGGSSNPGPGLPVVENVRNRVQQTLTNIQSRIKETRERFLGGRGILGGLMPSAPTATTASTEIVAKPPEKKPSKPARVGVHY